MQQTSRGLEVEAEVVWERPGFCDSAIHGGAETKLPNIEMRPGWNRSGRRGVPRRTVHLVSRSLRNGTTRWRSNQDGGEEQMFGSKQQVPNGGSGD